MGLRRVAAILVFVPLVVFGCYSPNIVDRGYACGDHGECPEHFHCASNHLCYQGDASIDMPVVCDSDASAPQVCTAEPAKNQTCNPGCQTGCSGCGWCAVVAGATKCLTAAAGTKNIGDICDPSLKSSCMPGLYCQPDCGAVGRCYRFCDSSDKGVCGTGSSCNVSAREPGADGGGISLPFTLCSLVSTCDAVSQKGCDMPYACYPTGNADPASVCECAGSYPTLQGCSFTDQCVRGDNCIQFGMMSQAICLQTCMSGGDCPSGTSCQNPMPTYGYCM